MDVWKRFRKSMGNKRFFKFLLDSLSIDKGDTAIGKGLKLPLVISTSIKAKALIGKKIININKYLNIIFNLLTSPLHQSLIADLSIFHTLWLELSMVDTI